MGLKSFFLANLLAFFGLFADQAELQQVAPAGVGVGATQEFSNEIETAVEKSENKNAVEKSESESENAPSPSAEQAMPEKPEKKQNEIETAVENENESAPSPSAEQAVPEKTEKKQKVRLEIFTDFQCPFCARFAISTHQLVARDDLQVELFQFPLDFHAHARNAAKAAVCAGAQGAVWEMHDLLFTNQNSLQVESLKGFAEDLQLDVQEFENCLTGEWAESKVQEDLQRGRGLGVSGTPTTFINGKKVVGALPIENIEKEIRAAQDEQ